MTNFVDRWLADDENRKLHESERLILKVTESIWRILEEKEITQAELATRLNTTGANISQLLNGSRNMTLKTLSDILFALEANIDINIYSKLDEEQYSPLEWFWKPQAEFHSSLELVSANEDDWQDFGKAKFKEAA